MPYNDVINTGLDVAENYSQAAGGIEGTFLENILLPGQVQQREFGQQVALQQMQNEWNSEQEKMRRLKEAGVNPLTAAQGVSGSGQSPATSSVPGQAVTSPLSDFGNAVSGIGQGVESIAKAKETRKLLENRNKNLVTDTFLKLKQAGYQDSLAKNLSIATMFLPQEKMLNLMAMAAEVPKINAEYKSIMQGIEESKGRLKEIDARIKLAEATANYQEKLALEAEKRTLQIEVQTSMDNWRFDKMKRLNLDPNNPIESNMFTMACEGNQDLVDKGAAVFRDIEYNKSIGAYEADEETSYRRAYNYSRGIYSGDPFQQQYRDLFDDIVTLQNDREDFQNMLSEAKSLYDSGKITAKQYTDFQNKITAYIKSIDKDIDRFQNEFSKGSYKMGHSSMTQDILKSAVSIGIGVGAYSIGKRSPVKVKGFAR